MSDDAPTEEAVPSRWTQVDAEIDCLCGGRMMTYWLDGYAVRTGCPECDRQPIDLLNKAVQ